MEREKWGETEILSETKKDKDIKNEREREREKGKGERGKEGKDVQKEGGGCVCVFVYGVLVPTVCAIHFLVTLFLYFIPDRQTGNH